MTEAREFNGTIRFKMFADVRIFKTEIQKVSNCLEMVQSRREDDELWKPMRVEVLLAIGL